MSAAPQVPMPEPDEIDRATAQGLVEINRLLDASGLSPDDKATVALCIGADCIMSAADGEPDAAQIVMGTIRTILETMIDKGWLPPRPPGARMVLILSDPDEGGAGLAVGHKGGGTVH